MKKLTVFALAFAVLSSATARAEDISMTSSAFYLNITEQMDSPNLDMTLMPGVRMNWARSPGDETLGRFLDELYIGPNYHLDLSVVKLHLSAWYYFAGIPAQSDDGDYETKHTLLLSPAVDLKLGAITLTDRVSLHNVIGNTDRGVDSKGEERGALGYGLEFRNLIQAAYQVNPEFSVNAGYEIYLDPVDGDGMVGSKDWKTHRVHLGVDYNLSSDLVLSPKFVYQMQRSSLESAIDTDTVYLNLTLGYKTNLF